MDQPSATTQSTVTEARDVALCRSILYEALALGFRPPSDETLERLGSVEAVEALADAAALLDQHGEHNLENLARQLPGETGAPGLTALGSDFGSLFGHVVRATVPPYETEYGTDTPFLQPQEMSDIAGFMHAFGVAPHDAAHERVDHISCECEFLCFLCRKEAYALAIDDEKMLQETRKGQRLFLRDHLGRFGKAFARRLLRENREGFYGALGALCAAFLQAEGHYLNVPVEPEHSPLRSATVDEVPMACESCSNLHEAPFDAGFEAWADGVPNAGTGEQEE